jgi:ferredoxin--NADP+ reductase
MNVQALRDQLYNARVVEVERHGAHLAVVRIRPDAPMPRFEAGQWILLGLGVWEERCAGAPKEDVPPDEALHMLRRPFSLSSSIWDRSNDRLITPEAEDTYEFYLALAREIAAGGGGPALPARLLALDPGARLWVADAPQGNYTLASVRPDDDVAFLATGTGEAPHNRMIGELLRRGHRGRIVSVVTVRRWVDLVYRVQHERLVQRFHNYRYVPIATQETSNPEGVVGARLQAMFTEGSLEERMQMQLDPERCQVFLCGNPDMLGRPRRQGDEIVFPGDAGMIELLHARGFEIDPPHARVHFERY